MEQLTFNMEIKKEKSKLTTPDCYEINKVLNKMKEKRIKNLFMEASSHALSKKGFMELNLSQQYLPI